MPHTPYALRVVHYEALPGNSKDNSPANLVFEKVYLISRRSGGERHAGAHVRRRRLRVRAQRSQFREAGMTMPLDPPPLESFMGNILRGCTYSRETQGISICTKTRALPTELTG